MKYIIDPRTLLDQAPIDSPYWALVDAFDAVTNGIENPEAMERLQKLQDPVVEPWKILIGAIKALYQEDTGSCALAVERLDPQSPPGVLKPLFLAWIASAFGGEKLVTHMASASASVADLFNRITTRIHPIAMVAEQAEEALRQGMIDYYEGLVQRVLRELREQKRGDGPLLAVRYALSFLRDLDAQGIGGQEYFSILLKALGKSDGFCVLGIYLWEKDELAAETAFRGALENHDGVFVNGEIRKILTFILAQEKQKKPKMTKKRAQGTQKQLELFT